MGVCCPSRAKSVGLFERAHSRLQAGCIREGIGTPGTVNAADGASGERTAGARQGRESPNKLRYAGEPGCTATCYRLQTTVGQSADGRQTSPDP